jgi:hypothetical protein
MSAGFTRTIVVLVAIALVAWCLPFLQGARGSYSAIVSIRFDDSPQGQRPNRYTLTLHSNVSDYIARPNSGEIKWKEFAGQREERVFGAFSSGWTLTGYQRRSHPYADVVLVEYRSPERPPEYRVIPIPWDAQKHRAQVTIPANSPNSPD